MYLGWLMYGGTEIWNSARTSVYASQMLPGVQVGDCEECEALPALLGDGSYEGVLQDQPAWFDPNNAHTWDFAGVLPLSVEGVEDSTVSTTVTDLIGGGGYVAPPLPRAREMRFTGLLLGADEAGVEAGMTWLKSALGPNPCSTQPGCTGDHLCFMSSCPELCESDEEMPVETIDICPWGETVTTQAEICMIEYLRHLRVVTTTSGPTVTQKYSPSCGAMWQVEWTMVAGVPDVYSASWYVGSSDVNPDSDPGEVVRVNLAPDPRGRVLSDDDWDGGGSDVWPAGYSGPGEVLATGFSRRNFVLDPRGARWGTGSSSWGYQRAGSLEISSQSSVTGATDGPFVLPGSRQVGSYLQSVFTRATPGVAGFYTTDSGLEVVDGDVFTGSAHVRRSRAGRVRAVVEAVPGGDPVVGPWVDAAANVWVRVSATDTVVLAGGGSASARLGVQLENASTNERFNATAALIELGSSVLPYFDGSSPTVDGYRYRWSGSAQASTSLQIPVIPDSPQGVGFSYATASADATGTVNGRQDIADWSVVSPNLQYAARMWVWTPPEAPSTVVTQLVGQYKTAGGSELGTPFVIASARDAGGWLLMSGKAALAPSNAALLEVWPRWQGWTAGNPQIVEGLTVGWGAVIVEQRADAPPDYFDGETTDTRQWDYSWVGAEDGTSQQVSTPECVNILEEDCPPAEPLVVEDPLCVVDIAPPTPPDPGNECLTIPDSWCRYAVAVPDDFIPVWATGLPVVRIRTRTVTRQVRFRFYSNPFDLPLDELQECDFCGEFFISYLPASVTATIDASTNQVLVELPGGQVATGSHLLYGTDGGPMSWPELVCGTPFLMTIDVGDPEACRIEVSLCVAWKL